MLEQPVRPSHADWLDWFLQGVLEVFIRRKGMISFTSRFLAPPMYLTRYATQVNYLILNQIIWFQSMHLLVIWLWVILEGRLRKVIYSLAIKQFQIVSANALWKLERPIIVIFWHLNSLHHHCQNFSLWFTCGHSGMKSKKPNPNGIVKSDDDIVINSKTLDMRSTRKGIAE